MPARWLKLTVAYDGGAYAGWQIQPDRPTVQRALEAAWREITQEHVRLTAAGRTDAGVHALGQVVGLSTETGLSDDDLLRALNAVLPNDVAVVVVEPAPESFHATYDAIGKRYRYQIHNGRIPSVFDRHYAWHYPQPLDAEAMHRAAQALVGRHDFSSFETAGSERPNSIRTIREISVVRGEPAAGQAVDGTPPAVEAAPLAGRPAVGPAGSSLAVASLAERVTIDVFGDGFLYNMVRTIVGTLVEVGRGGRPVEWPAEVLAARDRRRAGQTAPPQGLFLVHVDYA